MDRRIIAVKWYKPGPTSNIVGVMGLVLTENLAGERKVYIGSGLGLNELVDMESIADWGARVDPRDLIDFVSQASAEDVGHYYMIEKQPGETNVDAIRRVLKQHTETHPDNERGGN